MNNFTLVAWAGDKDTVRIQCECGKLGDFMSRLRDTDDAGVWVPQVKHLPKCGHLDNGFNTENQDEN